MIDFSQPVPYSYRSSSGENGYGLPLYNGYSTIIFLDYYEINFLYSTGWWAKFTSSSDTTIPPYYARDDSRTGEIIYPSIYDTVLLCQNLLPDDPIETDQGDTTYATTISLTDRLTFIMPWDDTDDALIDGINHKFLRVLPPPLGTSSFGVLNLSTAKIRVKIYDYAGIGGSSQGDYNPSTALTVDGDLNMEWLDLSSVWGTGYTYDSTVSPISQNVDYRSNFVINLWQLDHVDSYGNVSDWQIVSQSITLQPSRAYSFHIYADRGSAQSVRRGGGPISYYGFSNEQAFSNASSAIHLSEFWKDWIHSNLHP
jgi:hypothetical protein